jgi:single-strand DNA-binding protein
MEENDMSVNKAIILGFLGKDPEINTTQTGKTFTKFSVATTETWVDQNGESKKATTWHNVVVWGKRSEVIVKYFKKGDPIFIEGRIDNRSYDDKDGIKRYTSEIILQNFSFVGKQTTIPKQDAKPYKEETKKEDEDDLPF